MTQSPGRREKVQLQNSAATFRNRPHHRGSTKDVFFEKQLPLKKRLQIRAVAGDRVVP